ncbi:MAG: type IV secretion protein IcmV [Legionella sp.]|nr:type IV secretion protein IcmV [Legionella sp.]
MIKEIKALIKDILKKFKRIFFGIFKISRWLDWARVKAGSKYFYRSTKEIISPQVGKKQESFNSAVHTYKLNDQELHIKQQALLRLSLLMLSFATLILGYAVYQFIFGTIHAGLLSLVVMGIALVLAFRYHFWYFQIKQRKLGCTFQEWVKALRGGKNE